MHTYTMILFSMLNLSTKYDFIYVPRTQCLLPNTLFYNSLPNPAYQCVLLCTIRIDGT